MKRILVYGLSPVWGGTESYFMTLYGKIDRTQMQFDFLFPYHVRDIPYEKIIAEAGGNIYREYYQYGERRLEGAVSVREFFDIHSGQWDGIYINIQAIDTAYRLLVEARRRGMKYRVIHVHSSRCFHKLTAKNRLYEMYFHLTKRKNVTHFLACSDQAGRFAFHQSDYQVVPDAIDFERFSYNEEKRNQMRKLYQIREDTVVVGMCARLVYQKNAEFALKIFRVYHEKNQDSCFLLVGDGPERENIEQMIGEYQLTDSVILTGAVRNVPDFLQIMDIFLLPSRSEGFGIVLLEAQAAGLSCFTSRGVVPAEVNVTGHVHFVDLKKDEYVWAARISEVDRGRYDASELLKSSRYTVESSVCSILDLFDIKRQ